MPYLTSAIFRKCIRNILIISVALTGFLTAGTAYGQENSCVRYHDDTLKMDVYHVLDKPAAYPGGMNAILSFIIKHTVYPADEQLQGKVMVSFIVDQSGVLHNATILNKERKSYSKIDLEIIRVVMLMHTWQPGACNGENVASLVNLPLQILIQ